MFAKLLGSKMIVCAALALGAAGTAQAVTWDDYSDEDKGDLVTTSSWASYTHSILGDGYRPGIDSILGAELTIRLYDDHQPGVFSDGGESVRFSFNGGGWTGEEDVGGSNLSGFLTWDSFDFGSIANLLNNGSSQCEGQGH